MRRTFRYPISSLGALVLLAAASSCASPNYRYDRMDEDDGIEVRDLEDLIADSRSGGSKPGERLGLDKETVEMDFSNQVDEYRIGKNDVLNIFVVGRPELSSQRVDLGQIAGTTVQKDGKVHLPIVGAVQAEGMSVVEFTDHLRQALGQYVQDPHVSVEILQFASQKFYVLGHVKTPGAFPVDGDTSLLEGLGLAGGVLPEGDLEGAYVLRDGELLPISLADILLRGDVSRNILMRRGDVVYVPDNADMKVYVLGEVREPTVVPVQRDKITLAEALAAAGGPTMAQARAELAVLRGGFAKPTVYTVDLEEALLYDAAIALRPGDRVIVAPTGLSLASKYMQQILPFLQGVQALGIAAQGAGSAATQIQAAGATGN